MSENNKEVTTRFALVLNAQSNAQVSVPEAMQDIGLSVVVSLDITDALKKLSGVAPALIILDVDDDVLARQYCQELRRADFLRNVTCIMLANDGGRVALNEDYEAGATNVFIKPCDAKFLADRLRIFDRRNTSGESTNPVAPSSVIESTELPDVTFEIDGKGHVLNCVADSDTGNVLNFPGVSGLRLIKLLSTQDATFFRATIRRALKARKNAELEAIVNTEEGPRRYNIRLIVKGRSRLLAVFRDLESALQLSGQNRRMQDTLTGLSTRELFLAELDGSLSDAKLREFNVAVIAVDLDRFTKINETLGRHAGDIVLRESAMRIRGIFDKVARRARESSSMLSASLARVAGDEFVCLLSNIDSREAVQAIADQIRAAFDEPITIGEENLAVTPSLGIAIYPADGSDAESLFTNARSALDEARFAGIDSRAFYTDTMKFRSLKRPDVIKELGWAIENDQLELHYLPRIDLRNGVVTQLEALLRWMHPLRGSVPISDVIPLAEVSGLIRPLGEWILHTACAEASIWSRRTDLAPGVSVNLSRDEFGREDLLQIVKSELSRNSLDPGLLQFELTEAMLVRHHHSLRMLKQLQKLGVRIVIDDFGVGHSSLALLSQMPIDAIKIDKSFVDGAHRASEQAAICAAIIAMAHELGICVIAEGVETEEQLAFLREKGCDAAQGYLYSRPMPAAEVAAFLDANMAATSDSTISTLETGSARQV